MKNELVRFKGIADGVRVNIDADADMHEILSVLEAKIKENKAFFGDANCKIRFDGRKFTPGEKQRFTDIIKRLLPMCNVSFGADEKKNTASNDWIVEYKERRGAGNMEHPAEQVIEQKKEKTIEKEFYSIFRSNRARFYEGFVREGMTIRSDGHLILLGTALEGAELIAAGNILVMGGLYGTAHAGCNGHNGSYILAMDMRPGRLKIAEVSAEYTYEPKAEDEPPKAEEKGKRRIFEKLRKGRDAEEQVEEKEEKSELSAVALVKNNKIELDNFTIQTFTNPKNMV